MSHCAFCDAPLAPGPPWDPGPGHRLAFDPQRGRLWTVCPRCTRWNLTPLESRWETLEACEEAVGREGRALLSTPNLTLVSLPRGELIRVGTPPRPEFVDWRYGPRLGVGRARPGFWARLLSRLPAPPVEGYDPYRGIHSPQAAGVWLASPFLDQAAHLTYLFTHVPLAPVCPSCRRPMALHPWEFQRVRLLPTHPAVALEAPCAFCGTRVELTLQATRPALRLALGIVAPPPLLRDAAGGAARALDQGGGPEGWISTLARNRSALGDLAEAERSALLIALDEVAEAEALEAEWSRAEELAAIADGELTEVPGFDAFRDEVLGEGS